MCQREHFQKLMVMVMRTSDKRVAEKYKLLLNYVVKQCDQAPRNLRHFGVIIGGRKRVLDTFIDKNSVRCI